MVKRREREEGAVGGKREGRRKSGGEFSGRLFLTTTSCFCEGDFTPTQDGGGRRGSQRRPGTHGKECRQESPDRSDYKRHSPYFPGNPFRSTRACVSSPTTATDFLQDKVRGRRRDRIPFEGRQASRAPDSQGSAFHVLWWWNRCTGPDPTTYSLQPPIMY